MRRMFGSSSAMRTMGTYVARSGGDDDDLICRASSAPLPSERSLVVKRWPSEIRSTSSATESSACSMRSRRSVTSAGRRGFFDSASILREYARAIGTPMARTMAQAKAPSGTTISGPISVGPLGAGAVSGYRKLYLRSFARRARRANGSVVGPDRLTRDRQAESRAAGFVGDVRLPDRAERLRGDALAFIGHGDAHRVAPTEFCGAGLHRNAAVFSGSIDRVEEHVAQGTRQRSVVTVHPGKILVYLQIKSKAGRHTAMRSVTNELSHVAFRWRPFWQLSKLGEAPRHAIETL